IRSASSIFGFVMISRPIAHGYYPNGLPGPSLGANGDNPVVTSTNATGYDRTRNYNINTNFRLDINIPFINGLSFSGNASLDKLISNRKLWQTPWFLYSWDGVTYDD